MKYQNITEGMLQAGDECRYQSPTAPLLWRNVIPSSWGTPVSVYRHGGYEVRRKVLSSTPGWSCITVEAGEAGEGYVSVTHGAFHEGDEILDSNLGWMRIALTPTEFQIEEWTAQGMKVRRPLKLELEPILVPEEEEV